VKSVSKLNTSANSNQYEKYFEAVNQETRWILAETKQRWKTSDIWY
jgi:molybdopterin synthase catalytic subunit